MKMHKTTLVTVAATAASLTLLTGTALATTSTIPAHKVGICHATGSASNPYVFIVVDEHAVQAHTKHQDGRDKIGVKSAADCATKLASKPAATPAPKTPVNGAGSVLGTATMLPDTGGSLGALIGAPAMLLAASGYIRSRKRS